MRSKLETTALYFVALLCCVLIVLPCALVRLCTELGAVVARMVAVTWAACCTNFREAREIAKL